MRRTGLSLGELARKFSISKTTVWYHVKDIDIGLRGMGSIRKSMMDWDSAKKTSQTLIREVSKVEKIIIAAMLYWGEGTKKDFSLSNTDPQLIITFISCLDALGIEKDALRVSVRIYEDINRNEAVNYWSHITGVPIHRFLSVNVLKGKKKGKLQYGMCRLRVAKAGYYLKLLKSIKNLIAEKVTSPRSSKDRAPHS